MKRLYLTKEAGDDLWHYSGDPIRPTATFDVGMVKITNRDEIKVDAFGAYVLRETVWEAEEIGQWRDEIEALVEVAPSGARVINCYPEILVAIVEKALTEREEEIVKKINQIPTDYVSEAQECVRDYRGEVFKIVKCLTI